MIDVDVIAPTIEPSIPVDRPPPHSRNPDPDDLDRLAASLDALTLCCCEPGADEADDRRPPEAVAMHKQFTPCRLRASSFSIRRRSGVRRTVAGDIIRSAWMSAS